MSFKPKYEKQDWNRSGSVIRIETKVVAVQSEPFAFFHEGKGD